MTSSTWWMWVWVNSGSWWWTWMPGMLYFMWSQSRTWLSNWSELNWYILMSFPANYVIYILLVFLLIDFSLIMDIFFLLYTSRIFFFLNLCIFLNQRIITLQYWDETKTNTCPSFKLYYGCPRLLMCSLYLWMLDFFLIFINDSFHCLQTLLISWKQLHILKACCKVF